MSESISAKVLWDKAAKNALYLSLIPLFYLVWGIMSLNIHTDSVGLNFLVGTANFAFWMLKFLGCIALMRYFMVKLTVEYPDADNSHTFRYGVMIGGLSAIIVAAASYFNYIWFSAEVVEGQLASISSMLDSATADAIERMKPELPAMMFFSNLIWCFIYGLVLSLILSRNIPSTNPFDRLRNANSGNVSETAADVNNDAVDTSAGGNVEGNESNGEMEKKETE